uniref:Major facilitator superfamily (MFS) profile domain-containing protein n=1 Tax=Anopheles farauti TaxID=69004 RepID=A0A182QD60_9DIPT
MSLPKEWNLQTSQECLNQYLRPQSLFSEDIEIQPHADDNRLFDGVYHPSIPEQRCRAPLNAALLAEFENSGSMFSIQSAPVVTARTEPNNVPCVTTVVPASAASKYTGDSDQRAGTNTGATLLDDFGAPPQPTAAATAARYDTLLRPSSLALDTQYNSVKPHTAVEPQPSTELDEDDNENLLTVSSLTARPLIAKSREIRSKKQKLHIQKQRKQVASDSSEEDDDSPPDGGYGWIIVFGAFSVQFWVAGLVKSYGVLYVEIMENFPNASATTASWIPAILSALCLVLAPLSSALCQRFSCRIVVIIGGVFCGLGLTLSYFATSMYHLLFTFGILTGIGGGLSTTPGIVIVSQYFEKHRALANGITISGTAAGSFVFPMLIERLIHLFGFHGTLLILGGCMLHVCVSGALYRPLDKKQDIEPSKEGTQFSSRSDFRENLGHLSSSEDHLSKRCLEDLFLDDQNRNSLTLDSKFVNITEKTLQESEDELKDILSSAIFLKPISSIRSCSILHSVEDLSTDSTCVYKNRASGYDSKRNSMRYKQQLQHQHQQHHRQTETQGRQPAAEPTGSQTTLGLAESGICGEAPLLGPLLLAPTELEKSVTGATESNTIGAVTTKGTTAAIPTVMSSNNMCAMVPTKGLAQNNNRGLSKSMIIPTPVGDLDEIFDEDPYTAYNATLLEKISQYLDITLLQDITFILMCLSVALMSVGCPYMLYYLPAYVISAGLLRDLSGGYEICFYCMGVCMVMGSVPLVAIIVRDTIALKDKRLQLDQAA